MASAVELHIIVNSLKQEVAACRKKPLPTKHCHVISSIEEIATTLVEEILASSITEQDHIEMFRDLVAKATKRLNKLRKDPRRSADHVKLEGLDRSLKDFQNLHFWLKQSDAGLTVEGIFRNSDAKKFWSESFGSKELQVDWDRWLAAYNKAFTTCPLASDREGIIKSFVGSARGNFVVAARMDEACETFGFPFEGVKCCREKDCQCLEYKPKNYGIKQQSDDSALHLCNDCGHKKNVHHVLETRDKEPKGRGHLTGGALQGKIMLIDNTSSFRNLQKSILSNDLDLALRVIQEMTNIDEVDKDGCTALHTAAGYCSADAVELLLKHGASSKVFDKSGFAPVHTAARRGKLPALKALVSYDSTNAELPDHTEIEATPLHHAAEENRTDVIMFLTSKCRVNIDTPNSVGESATFVAAACGYSETIVAAAEMGADLSLRSELDESPIDIATREGSIDSIVVISQRAPETVASEDDEGNQPLSKSRTRESVAILMKLGADPHHRNKERRNALHVTACDPDSIEATRMLIELGVDVNAKDEAGQTSLHIATSTENEEAIEALSVEGKADINARDKEGKTPLLIALDRQFEYLSEKFVSKGADVNASDCRGLTALHYASKNGYKKLAERLSELGAIINRPDNTKKLPLHYAVITDPELAKFLVDNGANMYARDARGDTSLGLSRKIGYPLKPLSREEEEILDFTDALVKDLLAVPAGPCYPSKCFADGPGLKGGYVNTRNSFTVFACDQEGKIRTEGGDALVVSIDIDGCHRREITCTVGEKRNKHLIVEDCGNGTYAVAFELKEAGRHKFHITISGQPIQQSPYIVQLRASTPPSPPIISATEYTVNSYEEATIEFAKEEGLGQVDVAIVCDTTRSMRKEIKAVQALMQDLIDAVNDQELCSDLRIAIVSFRDHRPKSTSYVTRVWPLTPDVPSIKEAINSLQVESGGDQPEAVADAIHEVFSLNWDEMERPHAVRMAVLIGDAPPHGMSGLTCTDSDYFPDGCPDGHDWLILAEQCRMKRINIYTVQCRNDKHAQQAFSAIADSSGGKSASMKSGRDNKEIINLIKLHVQVQLDEKLASSMVSDTIVKKRFVEDTFDKRLLQVTRELSASGFTVRQFETNEGIAAIQIRAVRDGDVYKAIEDFRLCERLASATRDMILMDHMGKKLYALKKIEGTLPSSTEI